MAEQYLDGGRYLVEALVRRGAYRFVYLAIDTTTGDKVALKRMLQHGPASVGLACVVLREIACVHGITQHPNVLGQSIVATCTLSIKR